MKKTHKSLAKRLLAASLSLSLLFAASLTSCSDDDEDESYYERNTSGGVYTPTSVSVSLSDTVVNTVTLSWYYSTYNVGIYGWVYINTEDDGETAELLTSDISVSYGSYVKITYDIELEESGTYYFWVRTANSSDAESATNISDLSDAASIDFTYKTDPNFAAPENLESEVDSDSTSQVNLTWSAVDGASYYWVYYNTTNDAYSATLISSEVTGDEDTADTINYSYKVSYAGNYWFWVKAADGTNTASFTSDFSDSSGLYVSGGYSLTAPTDVAAADSGTTNTVKISWTKTSSSRYYYSIYYNTSDDSSTATLLKDDVYAYSTSASTTVLLTESGTYYFWVKTQYSYSSSSGVHTSDFSDASDAYEFEYTDLEAPSGVTVSRPYTNTLQVSWSDNGAAYYWVYYGTEEDSSTSTQLTKTSLAYTYLSLDEDDDNTTYYFWVQSADGTSSSDAVSGFSDAVSYTFTYKTLSAPTSLTATYVKSLDEYKLTWSSDALYHRVWQNTEDDTSSATQIKSLSLTYCYVDLSEAEAGTYYFWVQAADGISSSDAVSDFSDSCTITIEEEEETEE